MSSPAFVRTNPARAKRLKLAADCRCELCERLSQLEGLEIHLLQHATEEEHGGRLSERSILVLCSLCHRELHAHAISEEEERALIAARTQEIVVRMHEILVSRLYAYSPPAVDLEEAYREASLPNHHRIAC